MDGWRGVALQATRFQPHPFKPRVRSSRTRLDDGLHRTACTTSRLLQPWCTEGRHFLGCPSMTLRARLPLGGCPELLRGAWRLVVGQLAAGVVGPGGLGHALTPSTARSTTRAGALPSGCVVLHSHRQYCDPLGLPLRSVRPRLRLVRTALPRRRLRRRASPVPRRAVSTCRSLYPEETPCAGCPGTARKGRGLRRDLLGSALPWFLCRGGRIHLMLRPALLLPP